MNEKGQIILILILVMTVALAIGIAVIQRSLSDVSTSSKIEQSSKAFFAAEAGIEKAVQSNNAITTRFELGNNSAIEGVDKTPLGGSSLAIEYPSLAKEEMAQVWLADPNSPTLAKYYTQSEINVYWGMPSSLADDNRPAIEISVIYKDSSNAYQSRKYFLDSYSSRADTNKFDNALFGCTKGSTTGKCNSGCTSSYFIDTTSGSNRNFLCKTSLSGLDPTLPTLMMIRARFLYSGIPQPFAVEPLGGGFLPVQGSKFVATGTSGQTQRKVQVFRIDKVVPWYFDYAVFSSGQINKQ